MNTLVQIAKSVAPDSIIDFARSVRARLEHRAKLASLVARIRTTFPELQFDQAKLFDLGFDHAVVILDGALVFRFPRQSANQVNFIYELRLLAELKRRTTVAIPDYLYIAPGDAFGGYPLLDGEVMRPTRFQGLDRPAQEAVLLQIAELLGVLHALPATLLQRPDGSIPSYWADHRFSDGRFAERREVLAKAVDGGLINAIERFYEIPVPKPPTLRLVHTDIQEDHILLAPDGRSIGVIDFDAGLGDPAWDFASLWAWGDWAPPFIFEHYAMAAEDPGLLERSRLQSVRYWIERLYWRVMGANTHLSVAEVAALVKAELANVGIVDPS